MNTAEARRQIHEVDDAVTAMILALHRYESAETAVERRHELFVIAGYANRTSEKARAMHVSLAVLAYHELSADEAHDAIQRAMVGI